MLEEKQIECDVRLAHFSYSIFKEFVFANERLDFLVLAVLIGDLCHGGVSLRELTLQILDERLQILYVRGHFLAFLVPRELDLFFGALQRRQFGQLLLELVVGRLVLNALRFPAVLLDRVLVLFVNDLLLQGLQLLAQLIGRLFELLAHVNTFLILYKKFRKD